MMCYFLDQQDAGLEIKKESIVKINETPEERKKKFEDAKINSDTFNCFN